jgi:TIR domain-containing protein
MLEKRWWLKPGELAWAGKVGGVRWNLVYNADDGTTWSFTLGPLLGEGEYQIRYDYSQRSLISDGADRDILDVLGAINQPITQRVGPKIAADDLKRKIVDSLSEYLSVDEWMDGKTLRRNLRPAAREAVNAAIEEMIPKFVRRHPPTERAGEVDHYSLTVAGLFASQKAAVARNVIAGVVSLLGQKFDAMPSFTQYTLDDVRLALNIVNKVDMFPLNVIRIADLRSSSVGSGSQHTFTPPGDVEYIADDPTLSGFLRYVRANGSPRPSPTAPLLLSGDSIAEPLMPEHGDPSMPTRLTGKWAVLKTAVESVQAVIDSQPKLLASMKPKVRRIFELFNEPALDDHVDEVGYLLKSIEEFVAQWRPDPNPTSGAFYMHPPWARDTDREVQEARRILQEIAISKSNKTVPELARKEDMMKVFVSHSSVDTVVAAAFVELLRTALRLQATDIRCTSVAGYKLSAGAHADEQLRQEVFESQVFVALLSPASVKSIYVMFELGARWGAKRELVPVMVRGVDPGYLKAPLNSIHAVAGTSETDMHQLLDDLGKQLSLTTEKPAAYTNALNAFIKAAGTAP